MPKSVNVMTSSNTDKVLSRHDGKQRLSRGVSWRVATPDLPFPRQQLIEPTLRGAGDAGQDVRQPSLRIDVVEPCRHDQRRHDAGAIGTTFGAGEEP